MKLVVSMEGNNVYKEIDLEDLRRLKCEVDSDNNSSENIGNFSISEIEGIVIENAFSDCNTLTSINTENITEIKEGAFSSCVSLKEIELPKTIKKINKKVFSESGLESIVIPKIL